MRLINAEWNLDVQFKENMVNQVVIEEPQIYVAILSELYAQINGGEGKFLLSQGEKECSISKDMDIVINPFGITANCRKMQTKLQTELKEELSEFFYSEYLTVQAEVLRLWEQVTAHLPYELEYADAIEMGSFLKLGDIKFVEETGDLLSSICQYIKLLQWLLNVKVLVLVNIKSYLTKEQIELLYQEAFYDKVQLLLIESREDYHLDSESVIIIDKDKCLISYTE